DIMRKPVRGTVAVTPAVLLALLVEHAGIVVEAGSTFLVIVDKPHFAPDNLDEPDRSGIGETKVPARVHRHHAVDRHDADAFGLTRQAELLGIECAQDRRLERTKILLFE